MRSSTRPSRATTLSTPASRGQGSSTRLPLAAFVVFALAVSCASGPVTPEDVPLPVVIDPATAIPSGAGAEYSPDGLVRIPIEENPHAMLYVKPPRPNLQRYDSMILAPSELTYHERTPKRSRRDEQVLLDLFRSDLLHTLREGEFWKRTYERGAKTIIVKATIANLDLDTAAKDVGTTSATTFVEPGGGAFLGFEIFDSLTGDPLIRFMEKRQLPGGIYTGGYVNEQRLRSIFRDFANDLGEALRAHYDAVKEIERNEERTPGR